VTASIHLKSLLVDLTGLALDEIERLGRQLYAQLYLTHGHYGIHQTHDGQPLIFHERQFEHAFFTTSDYRCHPDRKDVLRPVSIARIHWIGQLVSGFVPGSACFHIPSPRETGRPPKRLYAVFETPFVVWLEPRKEIGWKFSSAYPLSIEEIRKYSRGGSTVWKWKEKAP
jgi:hypothetical protein